MSGLPRTDLDEFGEIARLFRPLARGAAGAFDLTDDAACAGACTQMLAGGPVQVIVNNAGIHDDAVFPGMRAQQWYGVIDVSLHGFFRVTQPLVLPMLRTRWGRIINVSSVAALSGNRGQVNYAASKAGLVGMARSIARELGSRSITANVVAPGFVETDMTGVLTDEQKAAIKAQVLAQPDRFSGGIRLKVQALWDLGAARCRLLIITSSLSRCRMSHSSL